MRGRPARPSFFQYAENIEENWNKLCDIALQVGDVKPCPALEDRHNVVGPDATELVAYHLSTEAWLRSWIASGQRAAA
jgi:hypothetical protein